MRLILCHQIPERPKLKQFPDDVFLFCCLEDFSVGPLEGWDAPPKFRNNRADFWRGTSALDLPDGEKRDYAVWLQLLPKHDLAELIESGVAFQDIPRYPECEEQLPKASSIEIWCDSSVNGCVFQWYLAAALPQMGVDLAKVTRCLFSAPFFKERSGRFWTDMILGKPARHITPQALTQAQWRQFYEYWQAVAKLPIPFDPALLDHADEHVRNTFAVLAKRFPDPVTGLSNIQSRLLSIATPGWSRANLVAVNAMIAGWKDQDTISIDFIEDELEKMSRITPPLVEIKGDGEPRLRDVRLTAEGCAKQALIGGSV